MSPATIALIALAAIVLIGLVYVYATRNGGNEDKLSDEQASETPSPDEPEDRCSESRTYDLIKRELFRRAAELRGSDQAAYDRLAAYAVVRMERPVVEGHEEEVKLTRCSGSLSLDLPPGVVAVGGRRTLTADVDYALQPAADGTGTVVTLENADAIIAPLATLGRATTPPPTDQLPADNVVAPAPTGPGVVVAPPQPAPAPVPPPPAPRAEPAQPTARPSFDCGSARTRSEIAVCRDSGLAALDRQMASQYRTALSRATPAQRALLLRTRDAFLAYRDRCPSNACISETYRGRMREIRDIMAGRWEPQS